MIQTRLHLTILILLVVVSKGFAQSYPTSRHEYSSAKTIEARVAEYSNGNLRIARSHKDGTPFMMIAPAEASSQIFDPSSGKNEVAGAVSAYFQNFATSVLQVPSTATLELRSSEHVANVWSSTFSIRYNGIPLAERTAKVVAGALTGKLMLIENNLPLGAPSTSAAAFTPERAVAYASAYAVTQGLQISRVEAPSLIYCIVAESGAPTLAYQVIVHSGYEVLRLWIDATSGSVLKVKNLIEYDKDGSNDRTVSSTTHGKITALVHPGSPYDSLIEVPLALTDLTIGGQSLSTDSTGSWSISGLSSPFNLTTQFSSPDFYTEDTTAGATNSSISVNVTSDTSIEWTDENSDVAERDAFYHVGQVESYMIHRDTALATGLQNVLVVNVNIAATCNAFYDPTTTSVNFFNAGGGCSNTGEIADVVYHEFGHRIADVRYSSTTGSNIIDASLGEGFADLVSAFMRDDPRIGIDFTGKGTLLRTCLNPNAGRRT